MTKIVKIRNLGIYGVAEEAQTVLLDLCALVQALLDSGKDEHTVAELLDRLDTTPAVVLDGCPIL